MASLMWLSAGGHQSAGAHTGFFFWDLLDFVSVCLILLFFSPRAGVCFPMQTACGAYTGGVAAIWRAGGARRAALICILGCLFTVSRSPGGASRRCSTEIRHFLFKSKLSTVSPSAWTSKQMSLMCLPLSFLRFIRQLILRPPARLMGKAAECLMAAVVRRPAVFPPLRLLLLQGFQPEEDRRAALVSSCSPTLVHASASASPAVL